VKILLPALLCALSLSFQAFSAEPKEADQKAFRETKVKAEQGDAPAQYELGLMYFYGQGVAKNEAEAVKWYRKAAKQHHAKAQFLLGLAYLRLSSSLDGEVVPEDEDEGVRLLTQAAHQGYQPAQSSLARQYHIGAMRAESINRDGTKLRVTAYQYYLIARANGSKDVEKDIKELEGKLTPAQKDEAMKFVREFKPGILDEDHVW